MTWWVWVTRHGGQLPQQEGITDGSGGFTVLVFVDVCIIPQPESQLPPAVSKLMGLSRLSSLNGLLPISDGLRDEARGAWRTVLIVE